MFALRDKIVDSDLLVSSVSASDNKVFILPHFLRKSFRFTMRLFKGEVKVPHYFDKLGGLGFLALTGVYGMIVGCHSQEAAKMIISTLGFAIEKVTLVGNDKTPERDILEAINLSNKASLIDLNVNEMRQSLVALPWVKTADVRRVYPATLSISLHERQAFAIWQHNKDLMLIDNEGHVIMPFSQEQPINMPLIIGDGAEEVAKTFVLQVYHYPRLAQKIRAYIRVAHRRWDLLLKDGVRIMLPENNLDKALAEIETLDREKHFLSRDIVSVDMRIEDKMSVHLSSDAMEQRVKNLNQELDEQLDRARKRV